MILALNAGPERNFEGQEYILFSGFCPDIRVWLRDCFSQIERLIFPFSNQCVWKMKRKSIKMAWLNFFLPLPGSLGPDFVLHRAIFRFIGYRKWLFGWIWISPCGNNSFTCSLARIFSNSVCGQYPSWWFNDSVKFHFTPLRVILGTKSSMGYLMLSVTHQKWYLSPYGRMFLGYHMI